MAPDLVAGGGQDEYYTYDGSLSAQRFGPGTRSTTAKSGISHTPAWREDWNFDPMGNWQGDSTAYSTQADGLTTLDQSRAHNQARDNAHRLHERDGLADAGP